MFKHVCGLIFILFYITIRWDNQQPISYQGWNDFNYKQDPFTTMKIEGAMEYEGMFNYIPDPLKETKNTSANILYPVNLETYRCTMMMIFNLAQTHWVNIACDNPLLSIVICTKKTIIKRNNITSELPSDLICENKAFLKRGIWYLFQWFETNINNLKRLETICTYFKMQLIYEPFKCNRFYIYILYYQPKQIFYIISYTL